MIGVYYYFGYKLRCYHNFIGIVAQGKPVAGY